MKQLLKWISAGMMTGILIAVIFGMIFLSRLERQEQAKLSTEVNQKLIGRHVAVLGDTLTIKYYQEDMNFILSNDMVVHKNCIQDILIKAE